MEVLVIVAFVSGGLALLRYAVGIVALRRYIGNADMRSIPKGPTPPISLLKPVYGKDAGLEENLVATLRQNYPEFEVIVCHERDEDPALEAVAAARAQVPDVEVRLVAGRAPDAINPKAAVLMRGEAEARHGIVAAADSDVRPDPLYLRDIANGLADADAVSFVPVMFGMRGLTARAAALVVNTEGFLTILSTKGRYTTGSTIGVRREALEKIGGFGATADAMADDHAMGEALKRAGCTLALARRAARLYMPHGDAGWALRWLRTIRAAAPPIYLAWITTCGAPLLLAIASFSNRWALALLGLLALLQAGVAAVVDLRFCWDRSLLRSLPLLPFVWIVAPFAWLAGWFGNTVTWRGRRYRVAGGRVRVLGP